MKSEKSKTLRKHAEEVNSLLAAIVESSDDAIIGKTLGTILSWNRGAQNMYGYSADKVPSFLQRIRQGQRIERYETVRMRKDGKQIEVSPTISPIKDSTATAEVLKTLEIEDDAHIFLPVDFEEIMKVSEQEKEKIREQAALLDKAHDAIGVRDLEHRLIYWNKSAQSMYALAADDGADAVALYAQNKDKIKVVLMDMMMPVMDGHAGIRAT